jgi:CheY-like chemotaxis protein
MGPAALIVDDDAVFRDLAALLFTTRGCAEVHSAADVEGAFLAFTCRRPDWVLIDVNLDGSSGTALARAFARLPMPPLIVLTSTDAAAVSSAELRECGAVAFVAKEDLATTDLAGLFSPAGS